MDKRGNPATSNRHRYLIRERIVYRNHFRRQRYTHAARRTTPVGISPCVTNRHRLISNLRASATIILLRVSFRPSDVRASYHLAKSLVGWNQRKRQASWIMPRRTRALPDLARPFSRRFLPLSSGEPVSPA